jgi:hypothetical protein
MDAFSQILNGVKLNGAPQQQQTQQKLKYDDDG